VVVGGAKVDYRGDKNGKGEDCWLVLDRIHDVVERSREK
jgi:hypothetical protein